MRLLASLFAVGLLLAVLPSPAGAGTQADPEIKDPAGDGNSAGGKDIVSAWVDLTDPTKLLVSFESGGTPAPEYPSFHAYQIRWTLWFKPTAGLPAGKNVAYVSIRVANGQTAPTTPSHSAYIGFTTTAGTFDNLNNEVSSGLSATLTGKVLTASVPMTNLKGFTVGTDGFKETYANIVLAHKGPAATAGGPDINIIRETYDRAPNTGFGRDYPSAPPAPTGVADFFVVPPEAVTLKANTTSDVDVVITNNGTLDFNAIVNVTGSQGVEATTAGDPVFVAANTTANVTITLRSSGDPGTGKVEGTITTDEGVNRTFGFSVTITAPTTGGNATNETATAAAATTEGGGIPGPGIAAAAGTIALVGALLRRGRRRA